MATRTFATLLANGTTGASIEEAFTLNELVHRIVVRNETKNRFIVFDHGDFAGVQAVIASGDNCHEVILGSQYQKIKIDWERLKSQMGAITTERIVCDIVNAIKQEFTASYFIEVADDIDDHDIIITTSSGVVTKDGHQDHKISYHFLVAPHRYAAISADEAQEFVSRVYARLAPEIAAGFDMTVYKARQNFRILGSAKDARVKTWVSGRTHAYTGIEATDRLATSLITHVDGLFSLPALLQEQAAPVAPAVIGVIGELDMARAIDLARSRNYMAGLEVRRRYGNMIVFNRIAPGQCLICNEVHHKDNTLIVYISDTDDGRVAFAKCRHATDVHRLGSLEDPEQLETTRDQRVLARASHYDPDVNTALGIENAIKYSEPDMRDLIPAERPTPRTLHVVAQMGLGKSKALKRFIRTRYPLQAPHELGGVQPRIVIVTFRQTFAVETQAKLAEEGFVLYTSQPTGLLKQSRLIVQVESLWRLSYGAIDTLILDESESIFEQVDSGLGRDFGRSFANFKWAIQFARHVVCMDALLGDRTYNIVRDFRGLDDVMLHHNQYQKAAGDVYKITVDRDKFIGELRDAIDAGENVFIPTNSLIAAKAVHEMLLGFYPDMVIEMYTKDTTQAVKREHFSNVDEYWNRARVVIITPTVSAGISFERDHFDRVFGYFVDMSCPVETCMQMIGRVRQVRKREFVMFTFATPLSLPVTEEALIHSVLTRRNNILGDTRAGGATPYLQIDINENGQARLHRSDYLRVWIENKIMKNKSRNNFTGRFIWRLRSQGARVEVLARAAGDGSNDVDFKEARDIVKTRTATNIAESRELSDAEAETLIKNMRDQKDVSAEDAIAVDKHKFRKFYKVQGALPTTVVEQYTPRHMRIQYRNLHEIKTLKATPQDAEAVSRVLVEIQMNERMRVQTLPDMAQTRRMFARPGIRMPDQESLEDIIDLTHTYKYDKHRYAMAILAACGWITPFDSKRIVDRELQERLEVSMPTFDRSRSEITTAFEVTWPVYKAGTTMRAMLMPINKVLDLMYGTTVIKAPKLHGGVLSYYQLKTIESFIVTADSVQLHGVVAEQPAALPPIVAPPEAPAVQPVDLPA